MATGQIKLPQNTDIKMNVIENSGAYSDSALLTVLRNSSLIQSRQIEAFLVPFTGGFRTGLCFLYEDTKLYGWILVFHYDQTPRYLGVSNGVTTVRQFATT